MGPNAAQPKTFERRLSVIDRDANPDEDQRQQHAIAELAGQSGQPADVVATIYRTKLAQLSEGASVQDFLILLAARRTREALLDAAQARA
jgi:hypothetical protein